MEAWAPGSVTAFFVPPAGDPEAGSRGASFAVEDGVSVAVEPARETAVRVDGEPAPFEPIEGVLARLDVAATVDVAPEVPIGCGFGASGAATLATALAADRAFGLERGREALVEAAHLAEVEAGTGLGDVFVQARGGLLWSAGDGRRRAEPSDRVAYESFGGIATSGVLGDPDRMERIRRAGEAAFGRLSPEPSLREVISVGWGFARETGLVTRRVEEAVGRVEATGGAATMGMLGETVVGVDAGGALANETRVSASGAHLLG